MRLFTITFAVPAGDQEFSFWREAAVLDNDDEAKGYALAKFEMEIEGAESGVQDAYCMVQARDYVDGETLEASNDPEADMDAFGPLIGEWNVVDEGESWGFEWTWGEEMEDAPEDLEDAAPVKLDS